MTPVTLTASEAAEAAYVGVQRRIESMRQHLKTKTAIPDNDAWGRDIEGAAAEAAFRKLIGSGAVLGVNTFHAPDVDGFQVRSTRQEHGRLIVREGDPVDDPYVLVVGELPRFRVVGWVWGREAMTEEWREDFGWQDAPKAWGVPQHALRPLETLPTEKFAKSTDTP